MTFRALGFAGIAAAICAVPALAHHSFAMFDGEQKVTLEGTVKAFQWIYPHSWILLMVRNSEGQLEQWPIEMGSPGGLAGGLPNADAWNERDHDHHPLRQHARRPVHPFIPRQRDFGLRQRQQCQRQRTGGRRRNFRMRLLSLSGRTRFIRTKDQGSSPLGLISKCPR
jgi:hypothetical protein